MDMKKFCNLDAEVKILGAVLMDNNELCKVIDILDKDDFYNDRHKFIYDSMVKLYREGKNIDCVTLCESLGSNLGQAGGLTYISSVIAAYLPSGDIKDYADIVKEKSDNRKLLLLLQSETSKLREEDKSSWDIISSMEDSFIKFGSRDNLEDGDTEKTLMEVMDILQERYENGGEIPGIKTGYNTIDKMLGGLNKEEFIILAARPSMGKTAMALNFALNTALHEKAKVAFFNLEMGKNQIMERALSATAKISCQSIKNGSLIDEEWVRVVQAASKISESNLYLYDKVCSLKAIKNHCKRLKIQKGLDIVIIDYLQLISTEEKWENRNLEISKISRSLKLLAKKLDITIIALSQLSRAPEARANHRPLLSDLRESGSLEQDADVVMFLYRDAYYNKDTEDKDIIENIIAKNRNGEVGIVKLKWSGEYQRIKDN